MYDTSRLKFDATGLDTFTPEEIAAWAGPEAPREQAERAAEDSKSSGRRRFVDPATCDRAYAEPELRFMQAMQEYKQESGRLFPTWSEVLEVLESLGYEKTA